MARRDHPFARSRACKYDEDVLNRELPALLYVVIENSFPLPPAPYLSSAALVSSSPSFAARGRRDKCPFVDWRGNCLVVRWMSQPKPGERSHFLLLLLYINRKMWHGLRNVMHVEQIGDLISGLTTDCRRAELFLYNSVCCEWDKKEEKENEQY